MKAAGIEVEVGLLAEKGEELNRKFFYFQREQKPYITLKFACSQDHFMAKVNGEPISFSNSESQQLVHKMRAENQAILIGVQTAIADNPTLNVRHWQGNSPLRSVIDPANRLPKESKLVQDHEPLLIFTKHHSEVVGEKKWIALGDKNPTEFLDCILTYCYKNINGRLHTIAAELLNKFCTAHALETKALGGAQADQYLRWARYMLNTSRRYTIRLLFVSLCKRKRVVFSYPLF